MTTSRTLYNVSILDVLSNISPEVKTVIRQLVQIGCEFVRFSCKITTTSNAPPTCMCIMVISSLLEICC